MPDVLKVCPLCSGGQIRLELEVPDFSVSHEMFSIHACSSCKLRFTNPRPAETEIAPYYATQAYISHTDEGNSLINKVYKQVRKVTLAQKVSLLSKLAPEKGKLLDVGCGTGYFLDAMAADGWLTTGVEVDAGARALAEQRIGKSVHKTLFEVNGTYQAITLWHVLEHMHQLDESLRKIVSLLAENAPLVLALPNWQSHDAQTYGKYWAAWDVPRHLYHFSPDSVRYLANQYNLSLKEFRPMKFDSYYVSLLSEQYQQKGISRYPKAMLQGLQSNIKAKKSGQYSSLIYVLTKQHA